MINQTGQYSLSLGLIAVSIQFIEPQWFNFKLIGLVLVLATLLFVANSTALILIKLFTSKKVVVSNFDFLGGLVGAILLAYISLAQNTMIEEVAVYVGIALGILFFILNMIFQQKHT